MSSEESLCASHCPTLLQLQLNVMSFSYISCLVACLYKSRHCSSTPFIGEHSGHLDGTIYTK